MNNRVELLGYYGGDKRVCLSAWQSTTDELDGFQVAGIYAIVCESSGKFYIGSAENIYNRIKQHLRQLLGKTHINSYLLNAFEKYQVKSFWVSILESCSKEVLLKREQHFLDALRPFDRTIGFNQTQKADRPTGYRHDAAAKEKMRVAKLGKTLTPEHAAKIAAKNRGRKHTEAFKNNLSESRKGANNPRFGYVEPEEKKQQRMKNFLSAPKWNVGLKGSNDPRLRKLASRTGCRPANAIECRLVNVITGESWSSDTIERLAKLCPISLPSLTRLKAGRAGEKFTQTYQFTTYESRIA